MSNKSEISYLERFFDVLNGVVKSESVSRKFGKVEEVLGLLVWLRRRKIRGAKKIELFFHNYLSSLVTKRLETPDMACIAEFKRSEGRSQDTST